MLVQYACGINDSRTRLMIKAEILKILMHFRELEPDQIINRVLTYLKITNRFNIEIRDM
jgi:hypothetical protein